MDIRTGRWAAIALLVALAAVRPALAQHQHHGASADSTRRTTATHRTHGRAAPTTKRKPAPAAHAHPTPAKRARPATAAHGHETHMEMTGMYGPYPMTREASGTSWQPDAARHDGLHRMTDTWMLMLHGFADLVRDDQRGSRGDEKVFSSNMLMGMAQRAAGPGTLGFRAMLSAEPATIGKSGYPLLLQTGETADGRTHLIDRQHPHDLFMELAGTYSIARGNRSLFLYAGLPGEPALGPPAFMHRFSGMAFPAAPITHHWLDSSHITFGVVTAGAVVDRFKLEVSGFRGREPDEDRWNVETPKLDSHALRVSFNPAPGLALQASYGRLESPEELEPEVDTDRTTASLIYARDWNGVHGEATLAWGRNRNRPGRILDAFAAEAAAQFRDRHNLFARAERVEKDELFPEGDPLEGRAFDVGSVSAGYRCDLWRGSHAALGIGVLGSVALVPSELEDVYGERPTSILLFARTEVR